jgi:hypothetical protein
MSLAFLQPWWLALLAVWPLFLLVARSREQRREQDAPDFLLWKRAAAKLPPAAVRARFSWRDLAWIAPLFLLTIGLAGPEMRRSASEPAVLILVDPSPSMETRGPGGETRRDRGIAEARRLLGSRSGTVEAVAGGLGETAVVSDGAGIPVLVVTDRAMPDLPARIGLVQATDDARNAGIVAAGFDPAAGLLVRVEADPGTGPRTLTVRGGDGREIAKDTLADPTRFRRVIPAELVEAAPTPIVVELDPRDALALDDRVSLVARRSPLRVAIQDGAPPSIERALRACPGVEIVHGDDPAAFRLFVAPVAAGGFETGSPAARHGGLSGPRPFEGLDGPVTWKAVFPLVRQPPGAQVLLSAGDAPLLVRHERAFVLLANPDEEGWASVPSFPLTIARLVESAAKDAGTVLAPAEGAVLSPAATHVMREGPAQPSRAPPVRASRPAVIPLAAWCFALAAAMMFALAAWSARRAMS